MQPKNIKGDVITESIYKQIANRHILHTGLNVVMFLELPNAEFRNYISHVSGEYMNDNYINVDYMSECEKDTFYNNIGREVGSKIMSIMKSLDIK